MSNTVVIVVEGVLRQNNGDSVITQGQNLYHGLKEVTKVALVSNSLHEDRVLHWLKINGFNDHPYFYGARETDPWQVGGTRLRQLQNLREGNNFVEMVVEPDPEIAAVLLHEGVPVLNFLHPKYSNPAFRPDYDATVKPWSTLVEEVERQENLRATDKRMTDD